MGFGRPRCVRSNYVYVDDAWHNGVSRQKSNIQNRLVYGTPVNIVCVSYGHKSKFEFYNKCKREDLVEIPRPN